MTKNSSNPSDIWLPGKKFNLDSTSGTTTLLDNIAATWFTSNKKLVFSAARDFCHQLHLDCNELVHIISYKFAALQRKGGTCFAQ